MLRDIDRLSSRTFDLLVIGGGIYGLIVACDAAERGLSVALIERGDFGSGTSFNHHRTIHGGLRYLQTLDLRRARESMRERRALACIAPSAVRPLPFVLPLPASWSRGPLAMRAGFLLDRLIAAERNEGLPDSHHLPAGHVFSADDARRRFPALDGQPMAGAAVWHDYITTEAERLTMAWAVAAAKYGAMLANYVEATALRRKANAVVGADAVDRRDGRLVEIEARVTVNATGSRVDRLLEPAGVPTRLPMLKAMNVVTRREPPPHAMGGRSGSGRNLFLVPWRGRSLFGTWESTQATFPTDLVVSEPELEAFLTDLNQAFPTFKLAEEDISFVHRGTVPAAVQSDGRVALEGRDQVHEARHQTGGLISVAGTKYTTARAVAERIVDRVFRLLSRAPVPCRTAVTSLPFPAQTGDALLEHVARSEMVVTLEDAVVRRTPLGALGYPGDAALDHAATIVAGALNWTPARRASEIRLVRAFYQERGQVR